MKSLLSLRNKSRYLVAPCKGAWIEILQDNGLEPLASVAPCKGAWIEIDRACCSKRITCVAPCKGAWIEMVRIKQLPDRAYSRSL